jgi:hypothetical protein
VDKQEPSDMAFMKMKKIIPLTILFIFLALSALNAQAPNISNAPIFIQELSSKIQGKQPAEIHAAIIKALGAPQRDIGSGLLIEQWGTPEGVLTFHPHAGPTFFEAKTKKNFHLLRTTNPVGSCLFVDYEMVTLPDPANHGSRYWLGNVDFSVDMTYKFTDSGQFFNQRSAQIDNFFMLYPNGKVIVRYIAPITPETLLESVAEGATIAHLILTSADGKHHMSFSITSSEQSRILTFGSNKPSSFCLDTSWRNFWK